MLTTPQKLVSTLPDTRYIFVMDSYSFCRVVIPKVDEAGYDTYYFYYSHYDSKEAALAASLAFRNEKLVKVWGDRITEITSRGSKPRDYTINPRSNNRTGKVGVQILKNRGGEYTIFEATWTRRLNDGKMKIFRDRYNFGPYGAFSPEVAFVSACRRRDKEVGKPILTAGEYLKLLNPDCFLDQTPRREEKPMPEILTVTYLEEDRGFCRHYYRAKQLNGAAIKLLICEQEGEWLRCSETGGYREPEAPIRQSLTIVDAETSKVLRAASDG